MDRRISRRLALVSNSDGLSGRNLYRGAAWGEIRQEQARSLALENEEHH
jgi:hypothetical protein